MTRPRLLLASVLGATSVLSACSDSGGSVASDSSVIHAEGSGRLPDNTVVDWVSYADAVVVATVLSEQAIPVRADLLTPAGAGVQGRTLSLRIDRRIWNRSGARPVPAQLQIESGGWVIRNFVEKRPFTVGRVRLEVGSAYLMPLAWIPASEFSPAQFGPLGSDTPALMGSDNRPVAPEGASGAVSEFSGKPLDEIAATLANAVPDPLAVKHFDLDPLPRWNAVLKEMGQPPVP
jgi:hypothetical protein